MVQVKRVYEQASPSDGYRVLVDRLWPRGVSKQRAALDVWLKEIAPSGALRNWFGHDPGRFAEFRRRYCRELARNPAVPELMQIMRTQDQITLVYGAKDQLINHAVVLQEFMSVS